MVLWRFIAAFALVLTVSPARAEKPVTDPCAPNFEVISGLTVPQFMAPSVWDASYGKPDRQAQFFSGVPSSDGTVLALGRLTERKSGKPLGIVFARLDKRAQVLSEKITPARGWEMPVRMLDTGDGYAVLSSVRRDGGRSPDSVRVAWYNKAGVFRREKILREAGYGLEAASMALSADKGLVLALHAARVKPADEYSIVLKLDRDGSQAWRRTYRPGAANMIADIVPAGGDGFLALGRMQVDDKRQAAWAMRLGSDGTIRWQRSYARGGASIFRRGMALPGGGFAVIGDARPSDGTQRAVWIMMLSDNGDPGWQRYYHRADTAYTGVDLMRQDDGRIAALVNAVNPGAEKQRSFIRLMTLSPLGVLLGDESYIKGDQAKAYDLTRGPNGERIVTASFDAARDSDYALRYQGWVLVATKLATWQDPCLKKP